MSRKWFVFFSKTAPKLRLSTFNNVENASRRLADCFKKRVTMKSFHQLFQTTRTELEKVRLTFFKLRSKAPNGITVTSLCI